MALVRPHGLVALAALLSAVSAGATIPGEPATPSATGTAAEVPVYTPTDKDERGLWMEMDEAERTLKASPLVIHDPALNAYVMHVLCRTAGEAQCRNVRLYIVRTPHFNASMSLNGVMQVYSGLLLRTQNEAQLAAVLGHEYSHFERRHSLLLFREIKSKTNSAVWLSFTGIGLIASLGMTASIFSYSRDMEREADREGLSKMANAGYDTREAAHVWEQLRAEMDATAAARNTRSRKDKNGGMFATHPPSAERVAYLQEQAKVQPGQPDELGLASYQSAMAQWWPTFVDDQLKMNDFGASEYLLGSLAQSGWTPWLLYARGELYRRRATGDDLEKALTFFDQAIANGGELPALWRGRGLSLIKSGKTEDGQAALREYLRRAPAAPDRAMIGLLTGGTQ